MVVKVNKIGNGDANVRVANLELKWQILSCLKYVANLKWQILSCLKYANMVNQPYKSLGRIYSIGNGDANVRVWAWGGGVGNGLHLPLPWWAKIYLANAFLYIILVFSPL